MIDKEIYQNLYYETLGSVPPKLISSVDHVYGSFPLRVIDSHNILLNYDSPLILLWDITKPFIKKFRTELILDSGIFISKSKEYQLFDESEYYCTGNVLSPDFNLQRENLEFVFQYCLNYKNTSLKDLYLERFDEFVKIYKKNIDGHPKSSEFFINFLADIYNLLEFKEISKLISKSMASVYDSGMATKLIAVFIKETANDPFGFTSLLKKKDLFKPPYFRYLSDSRNERINFINKNTVLSKIPEICSLLNEGKIIPSHEIFFWVWSLCGIKHFGNDFGFLKNIEKIFEELGIHNTIGDLQLTEPKKDGASFIEFDNVLSYTQGNTIMNKRKFKKVPSKLSRVSNISSIYLHLGKENLLKYWNSYQENRLITKIKMGNII